MSGEIYKCSCCKYESLKKYNLYRHMVRKHEKENFNFVNNDFNPVIKNFNPVINDFNPVINDSNSVIKNSNFVSNGNICFKCNKKMSSKYYLKIHFEKCKGTINPLECPKCNKIFSHRSSKFNHIKNCKGISNELIVRNDSNQLILSKEKDKEELNKIIKCDISNEIIINDNTTNNIINNKQNNCNNNTTYNINLIVYDKENDKIEFDLKHMNIDFIYKLTSRNETDAFKYYCEKLFENKNNQMIIKSNFRNKYSKIHVGSNIWENFLDQHIYPKMMSVISETMIEYINIDNTDNKKKNNKIKYLDNYLQIMASDGYSNSETQEYKKKYKNNIEMLKILFNSFM